MYDDQDRPPWLRNLRPPRPESEPEFYEPAPTVVEQPIIEPGTSQVADGAEAGLRGVLTRRQMLLLALLLWGNVSVLGCLCLLATQAVIP
jgi:hypothetical protein